MSEFTAWLDGTAARVFALSLTLFVVMNTAAVALVLMKRDRGLVNRWTARWLAANLLLIGGGIGVPLAATAVRLTLNAFTASRSITLPSEREAPDDNAPPVSQRR